MTQKRADETYLEYARRVRQEVQASEEQLAERDRQRSRPLDPEAREHLIADMRQRQAAADEVYNAAIDRAAESFRQSRRSPSAESMAAQVMSNAQQQYLRTVQAGLRPPEPREGDWWCVHCHSGPGEAGYVRIPQRDPHPGQNRWEARATLCPACSPTRLHEIAVARVAEERADIIRKVAPRAHLMNLGARPFHTGYLQELPLLDRGERERATRALALAQQATDAYTERWPNGAWLSYDGGYGVGKTHFLAMIYRRAVEEGKAVYYTTGPEFTEQMLTFSGDEAEHERKALTRRMIAAEVLLIDEADRMPRKDGDGWVERGLFYVLDKRIELAEAGAANFHTVLAGNALYDWPGRQGRLPGTIKSRGRAAGSYVVDLRGVPDARPIFSGDDRWRSSF